jgi:hypothetical protein
MADRDKILSYISGKGPVLPLEIAKLINSSIILASAYMSELISSGLLKISSVKVGGSPLYYAPGQEAKLDQYIPKLHEKEQRAVNLLRETKVLKDVDLDSLTRVCLRNAKDFAKAIEVVIEGEKQLFWKFHTAQKEEIESVIKSKYMNEGEKEKQKQPETKIEPEKPIEQLKKEEPKKPEKIAEEPRKKPEPKREVEPEKIPEEVKRKYEPKDEQRQIFEKKPEKQQPSGTFYGKVKEFFDEHKIKVINEDVIKKNNQFWFIALVPASIGYITYYCEAKNKKTVSSSDISEALARGQSKRLPILFLANGKPSKSTEQMMENEFKNVIVKGI